MHATNRFLIYLAVVASVLFCRSSQACFWDYDTIRDERRGMPGIAEVIAGRYEKHSKFFYEQRVLRMIALLKTEPKNLDAWDNLAVGYEKLDDHAKAIETILKKDAIAPGQYTTYANLGTFYLHSGKFDEGISAIQRALQINPDAHFGREEYQLQLAIYLRDARKNPELLTQMNFFEYAGVLPPIAAAPLATEPTTQSDENSSRRRWATRERFLFGYPTLLSEMGVKANVFDGIVGIIRFGNGNSAELWLVLGDLLSANGNKNLAIRAYQRAIDLHHPRTAYLQEMIVKSRELLVHAEGASPSTIAKERDEAAAWVRSYQDFEDDLVRRGVDTENPKNFEAFYAVYGSPVPSLTRRELIANWFDHHENEVLAAVVAVGILTITIYALRWLRRHRARKSSPTATS